MQLYSILTYEYDANMELLLNRRLNKHGVPPCSAASDMQRHMQVAIADDAELRKLSNALAELLLIDIRHFELAKMVNRLPFSLREKQTLLPKALSSSVVHLDYTGAANDLFDYLTDNKLLVLEGYLRFRLQNVMEMWSVCVDSAAEEMMLNEEYLALTQLLGLFAELQTPNIGEVNVVLHPDGSCTLTDSGDVRIDCAPGSNDGVVSMLVGMSPERIVIYDLSYDACDELIDAIRKIFGAKVSFYS